MGYPSCSNSSGLDFETTKEYVKYLELRIEYQTMKESMEKIRKQLKTETPAKEAEGEGNLLLWFPGTWTSLVREAVI